MRAYWEFSVAICDAGGLGYSFIYPNSSTTGLTFTVSISVPNQTTTEHRRFVRPLLQKLNDLGIQQAMPTVGRSLTSPSSYEEGYKHEPPHLSKRRNNRPHNDSIPVLSSYRLLQYLYSRILTPRHPSRCRKRLPDLPWHELRTYRLGFWKPQQRREPCFSHHSSTCPSL